MTGGGGGLVTAARGSNTALDGVACGRLQRALDRQQVAVPPNVVACLDTLPAFRSLWPGLPSYKLHELADCKLRHHRGRGDTAATVPHDAADDTRVLEQLVAFVPLARQFILERHFIADCLVAPSARAGGTGDLEQRLSHLAVSPGTD